MKLRFLSFIICVTTATFLFGRNIVPGFYINPAGDTIHSRFVVDDLFDLHKQLVYVDSADNHRVLWPDEIRSFSFKTSPWINSEKFPHEIDHFYDQLLISKGYLYKPRNASIEREINMDMFFGDSVKNYQSIDVGEGKRLFLSVENGNGYLKTATFYTKLSEEKFYLISSVWLMIKDDQIIPQGEMPVNQWAANCTKEYKTLSNMILNKQIKGFPWDFRVIVNDYNNWLLAGQPDTTMYLKGYIDAGREYSTFVAFTVPYLGATAFFLPGQVAAVIISHNPKEAKIKVPGKLPSRDDPAYQKGFRHKAYAKKYKAVGKGVILGTITWLALLIVITSS